MNYHVVILSANAANLVPCVRSVLAYEPALPRARPSRFEKARLAGERLPIVFEGMADVTRNRSGPYDPEGASQMGGQR